MIKIEVCEPGVAVALNVQDSRRLRSNSMVVNCRMVDFAFGIKELIIGCFLVLWSLRIEVLQIVGVWLLKQSQLFLLFTSFSCSLQSSPWEYTVRAQSFQAPFQLCLWCHPEKAINEFSLRLFDSLCSSCILSVAQSGRLNSYGAQRYVE